MNQYWPVLKPKSGFDWKTIDWNVETPISIDWDDDTWMSFDWNV